MESPSPNHVLFLCTGNFYRSRYAELLFNHLALEMGIACRAFSRGLALELGIYNIGPISYGVVAALDKMRIPHPDEFPFPLPVRENDLAQAEHIVALKEAEHRELLRVRFPGWEDRVDYWHIHDTDQATVAEALAEIEQNVRNLVQRLDGTQTNPKR